jgi:hypothetical protein
MPALVAGIHVLRTFRNKDADGRDKPGHDISESSLRLEIHRHAVDAVAQMRRRRAVVEDVTAPGSGVPPRNLFGTAADLSCRAAVPQNRRAMVQE